MLPKCMMPGTRTNTDALSIIDKLFPVTRSMRLFYNQIIKLCTN